MVKYPASIALAIFVAVSVCGCAHMPSSRGRADKLEDEVAKVKKDLGALRANVDERDSEIEAQGERIGDAEAGLEGLAKKYGEQAKQLEALRQDAFELKAAAARDQAGLKANQQAIETLRKRLEGLLVTVGKLRAEIEGVRSTASTLQGEIKQLEKKAAQVAADLDITSAALSEYAEKQKEAAEQTLKKLNK